MTRARVGLYGPLLLFVLVQALIVVGAPSRAPGQLEVGAAPDPIATQAPGDTDDGEPGTGATAGTEAPGPGSPTGSGATPGGGGVVGPTTGPTSGPTSGPGGGGDTSHCSPDGRQTAILYYAPPCAPKWEGGDNGGATWQGVTADTVTVAVFQEQRNEAVTQILAAEGLRESRAAEDDYTAVFEDFLNEHFEFYGRRLELVPFPAPSCPETPPEPAPCTAEANRLIQEVKPFAVIWPVPTYPEIFDIFAANGVISLGGWHHDNSYFAGRRPFRWDVLMDGTRTAELVGEYYCKKMAGQMATHTGRVIHRDIGLRGQVPRRLGILTPESDAHERAAKRLAEVVAGCGDPQPPEIVLYSQNIVTATQQASANTQAFIAADVTTIVCLCDPIAPVFRTTNMTRNEYFPENLIAGSGLLDFDKIGRLYDKAQMAHAFGPSHLQVQPPHSQSDASIVWRDQGRSGDACGSCNLPASYYQLIGTMIQVAGPHLDPFTVERGMLALPDRGGWAESGRDPTKVLARFGSGDHTLVSDAKIVYWSNTASSTIDNRPGSWVPLDGGRRWTPGTFTSDFRIPVPAS